MHARVSLYTSYIYMYIALCVHVCVLLIFICVLCACRFDHVCWATLSKVYQVNIKIWSSRGQQYDQIIRPHDESSPHGGDAGPQRPCLHIGHMFALHFIAWVQTPKTAPAAHTIPSAAAAGHLGDTASSPIVISDADSCSSSQTDHESDQVSSRVRRERARATEVGTESPNKGLRKKSKQGPATELNAGAMPPGPTAMATTTTCTRTASTGLGISTQLEQMNLDNASSNSARARPNLTGTARAIAPEPVLAAATSTPNTSSSKSDTTHGPPLPAQPPRHRSRFKLKRRPAAVVVKMEEPESQSTQARKLLNDFDRASQISSRTRTNGRGELETTFVGDSDEGYRFGEESTAPPLELGDATWLPNISGAQSAPRRGLFTKVDIEAGGIITSYSGTVRELGEEDVANYHHDEASYFRGIGHRRVIDGFREPKRGYGMAQFANDPNGSGKHANCKLETRHPRSGLQPVVYLVSTSKIMAGTVLNCPSPHRLPHTYTHMYTCPPLIMKTAYVYNQSKI